MEEVELPLIEVLAAMEREGLKLDPDRLAAISDSLAGQAETLQDEIWELAGHEFTIGSPQQLAEVFFNELGLSKKRRGKTGFSTDARVLAQIRDEHEIVAKVERWRELTKLKNTYLDSLPGLIDPQDRPGPHDLQPGAGGDRPALVDQPEPAEHPDPLRARPADPQLLRRRPGPHAGLLRLQPGRAAGPRPRRLRRGAARDLRLRRGRPLGDRRGIIGADPEAITAGERSKAKMVNYGIAYGLSAFGLADRLGIDVKEAGRLHQPLLRDLRGRQALHRRDDRAGDRGGSGDDPDGTPPADPRAALVERPDPLASASASPSTR